MNNSLRLHWPKYFIEAALLGLFMVSASVFTMILEHPDSGVVAAIPDPIFRRALIEAPISGMSMNPARSLGSAVVGHLWTALWIYLTAPLIAMRFAAFVYQRTGRVVYCAKLHHHNDAPCIFNLTAPLPNLRQASGGPPTMLTQGQNLRYSLIYCDFSWPP